MFGKHFPFVTFSWGFIVRIICGKAFISLLMNGKTTRDSNHFPSKNYWHHDYRFGPETIQKKGQ